MIPQETHIKIILFKLSMKEDSIYIQYFSKKDIRNVHVSAISRLLSGQTLKETSKRMIVKYNETKKNYWEKNGQIFTDYGEYTIFAKESDLEDITKYKALKTKDLEKYVKIHNDEIMLVAGAMITSVISSFPILRHIEKKWVKENDKNKVK